MKKKRTAKQIAATKKLVAMNKKRTRVSKTATKVITKTIADIQYNEKKINE